MKSMLVLTELNQLKALSVPIRAEIMMRLIERPLTGQMLSELLNLSRPKVHYHLKELEKNNLIELVRTEEKGGILQKFYQSVARGFTPSSELLPHVEFVSETSRQLLLQMTEATKSALLSAPSRAFSKQHDGHSPHDLDHVGSMWQIEVSKDEFKEWIKKYHILMNELNALGESERDKGEQHLYYISTMAFEIDEPVFGVVEKQTE